VSDVSKMLCFTLLGLASPCGSNSSCLAAGPHQATGFKIGEVADTSAIVWTRLTARLSANPADGPMVTIEYSDASIARSDGKQRPNRRNRKISAVRYPAGLSAGDLRDAAPGAQGQVRVLYTTSGGSGWSETPWHAVDSDRDFTHQFKLDGLQPNTRYLVRVESRTTEDSPNGDALDGRFLTAPAADDPARVVFTVSTGQRFPEKDEPDGFRIYSKMLELDPSFFVHTGDIVYYDRLAKTPALARYHWQRTYGLPTNVAFHRQVASYFIKDDHDTWLNDCWPTLQTDYMHEFTFEQGLAIFREQVPMGQRTYRTQRWGRDLQVWLVEGRDFRSPNTMPDGPDKTIWGAEQKAWFKRTVAASDATFRVLISPTPMVGPDRKNKRDNHSNAVFANEGRELREFIASQKNMVVVCGDRHWQYHSIDPDSGVREYSCGPASDEHAGGWRQSDFVETHHRYLNVIGGFLSATVERVDDKPTLTFRFHDSQGEVQFEDALSPTL